MMRWIGAFIILLSLAGCGSSQRRPWDMLTECKQENRDLTLQVQQLQNENAQLTDQLKTMLNLDSAGRLEAIDTLQSVRIGKHSGFYDKDEDGLKETLVVYLEPLDTTQDTIKAPGQARIQLWNLNAPENNAKLNEWNVEPAALQTAWGGTIFNSYYRIKLPMGITPEQGKEYTLKISFTDYIGGKVLNDQTVITP